MKIEIAARLKPFSHTPGMSCVIPKSNGVIEAFPTLLRINGKEWKIAITGPVHGFTLQQDLERDCVYVFGKAKEGYFRLRIESHDDRFQIVSEKGPLKNGEIRAENAISTMNRFERLSLGSHKAQDWDLVQRRGDLKEILPTLFYLGQKIPHVAPQPLTGTAVLLNLPEGREKLEEALLAFIKAGFKNMLVPRLVDDQHQGFVPEGDAKGNPIFLIQEGSKMIRSLFFRQNERRLSFLPHLPISFDAGRMVGLIAPGIGEIDLEWSKKLLRRAVIRAAVSGEVIVELQKEIKTFRISKKKKIKRGEPLLLEAGKTYHLDRFEK
ncbi:MAG: hypothetical protein K1X28_10185 [Parachlamydiales bacterium]|nr:hypothetical protein [Parachlamydiales bacterium]